jgi:hypothetical protein
MTVETFGPDDAGDDDGRGCLFVLGWSNRPAHPPVRWLVDRITGAGWRVHVATLPLHVTDVRREWVEPVETYAADELDEHALLAHSAGGLTSAHASLPGATTRTYLSPWWGEPPSRQTVVTALAARLPVDLKVLPTGLDSVDLLGPRAVQVQIDDTPQRVSPAFVRAIHRAHRTLPPIDDDAVVFCTLSDRVVGTRAIGDRVPPERIQLYAGGHEVFSCARREDHVETLLATLEDGPAALD